MTTPATINRTIAEKVLGLNTGHPDTIPLPEAWIEWLSDSQTGEKGWAICKRGSEDSLAYYNSNEFFDPYRRDDHAMMAQRALPDELKDKYAATLGHLISRDLKTDSVKMFDLINATSQQRSEALFEVLMEQENEN